MQSDTPYRFFYTDHYFYISAKFSQNFTQILKISRLTNKMQIITQQQYKKEVQEENIKSIYATQVKKEAIWLVIGTFILNEEPYLMLVTQAQPVGILNKQTIYQIKNIRFTSFKHKMLYKSINQQQNEKILYYIKDDIISNNFYFCYRQQLTMTRQRMYKSKDKKVKDSRYFWNEHLLQRYPQSPIWKVPIVQGYVRQLHCENSYFDFYYLSISRRSKQMSGTRFNSRGIDFNGNVSNFVETQEIFVCHQFMFSHVSLRGSVPIFWKQASVGAQIIFYNFNEFSDKSDQLIKKHYCSLQETYNGEIVTVNLLSKTKAPEKQLKKKFDFYYMKNINKKYIAFDFNEETKDKQLGQSYITSFIENNKHLLTTHMNFFCKDRYNEKLLSEQNLYARINCLDCLDRTNVIMSRISQKFILQVEKFINANVKLNEKKLTLTKDYTMKLMDIWAGIGNAISMIYCGTESIASHLTKKQNNSFMSSITGGIKSLTRYYNANVNDSFKQQCLNHFLNKQTVQTFNPLKIATYFEDNITQSMVQQFKFCKYDQIGLYILTWNCNMVDPDRQTVQSNKLFWFKEEQVDIIVVNLQQMVQLSSYNVLLGSNDDIIVKWRKFIEHCINDKKTKKYKHLIGYDLVGIATFVFVQSSLSQRIVQPILYQEIKTGFKGSLGNKGAIMIFIQIDSSKITFINCHLSAGENKQNERSQDIDYILQQAVKDRKNRRFLDRSEYKFLIGDMNFRLEAKGDYVRQILYNIEKQQQQLKSKLNKTEKSVYLSVLLEKDQLKLLQQNQISILSSFSQYDITFLPTYKFIKKSQNYDTKRRPSWCDRILYYSKQKLNLTPLKYNDIPILDSDHKPVCGLYQIMIKKQNENIKRKLIQSYLNG